ncbi:unnamed protein product [Rotaria sp. Silwood2]|nr:unnamed protein product [Rotaria sp. Silwood2]CAF2797070.1 unnamed protein product [Rotaria sp. Silwood2]CAF3949489.1 unnamed protein product [Rotaria sp. Silwood2]CAF3971564.1 unnamed protein product [Rotaria sp. Silwood2]
MVSYLAVQLASIQQYMGWIMIIYIVFGNIGNLCNCLVFLRKQLRSNSCSCYLLAGSISNIIVLSFVTSTNIFSIEQFDPTNNSLIYCKLRAYFSHIVINLSRFLIVLACFDRVCISSSKVSMRNLGKVPVALRIIFLTIVCWSLISVHALVWNTISNGKCIKPGLYNIIFGIYVFIVIGVAPLILMITFSLVTWRNIRVAHRRVHPASTISSMRQRDFQLTRMLVAEVVVYVLSTIPFPVYSFYSSVTMSINKSVDQQTIEAFINFIATVFMVYINPSSTFYVYLATSKTFRVEFKAAVKNIWHRVLRRNQQRQPLNEPTMMLATRFL